MPATATFRPDGRYHLVDHHLDASAIFVRRSRLIETAALRARIVVLGYVTAAAPKIGRLLIMRGDRCLHSVRAVAGEWACFHVIVTYDDPDPVFRVEENLDPYLYPLDASPPFDPNYRR